MLFGQHLSITHQAVGVEASVNMGIAMNGKVFKILLDGLYSDKIGSIVRETISNAFDSHIRAGSIERPFQVHAPNRIDPTFRVRDFGVGMTHSEMFDVFANLGLSTKDGSNEEVGCYGLGAKCPLSYVDAFNVTCHDGETTRIYTVAWAPSEDDDVGMPRIDLMQTFDSTEERGVEVSIPVKMHDIDAFTDAITHMSRGVVPTFDCNVPLPEKAVVLEENGVTIFSTDVFNGAVVRQGCVTYPIDDTKLVEEKPHPGGHWSNGRRNFPVYLEVVHGGDTGDRNDPERVKRGAALKLLCDTESLMLDVPIGTIDVTASREAIQYTPRTVAALKEALERARLIFMRKVDALVETITDDWSAALVARQLDRDYRELALLYEHVDVRGRPLPHFLQHDVPISVRAILTVQSVTNNDRRPLGDVAILDRAADVQLVVMHNLHRPKGWLKRLKHFNSTVPGKVYVVTLADTREAHNALIAFLDAYGHPNPLTLDDLPEAQNDREDYVRSARRVVVWRLMGDRKALPLSDIKQDKALAYVLIQDGEVLIDGVQHAHIFAALQFFLGDTFLVGVAPSREREIKRLRPDLIDGVSTALAEAQKQAMNRAVIYRDITREVWKEVFSERGITSSWEFNTLQDVSKALRRSGIYTPFSEYFGLPDPHKNPQASHLKTLSSFITFPETSAYFREQETIRIRSIMDRFPYLEPLCNNQSLLKQYLIERTQDAYLPIGPDTYEASP